MSLWGKTLVESGATVSMFTSLGLALLLNGIGDALFVFKEDGSNASTAATLVQVSAVLLLLVGLASLGCVLGVRVSTERPRIPRLGTKMAVLFVGAGLFTMISHLVRLASTFYVWKPSDSMSDAILSKPVYYISGMGLEICALILYAFMRIDLLFSSAPTLALAAPSLTSTSRTRLGLSSAEGPLRLNPVLKRELSASPQPEHFSLARSTSSPPQMDRESLGSEKERTSEEMVKYGSDDLQDGMVIEVHRTFSISSQRVTSIREEANSR